MVEAAPNPYIRSGFTQSSDEFFLLHPTRLSKICTDLPNVIETLIMSVGLETCARQFRPRAFYKALAEAGEISVIVDQSFGRAIG